MQLLTWSKGEAQPAQHVAHNGLARLVSHLHPLCLASFVSFFFYLTLSTPNKDVNILTFRDSHLTLDTKVHLALILNAHQKKKERSKQRKDLRNQNAEEGKMYFVYMVKCSLFNCGFLYVLILLLLMLFWLRSNGPFLQPRPSTISLT